MSHGVFDDGQHDHAGRLEQNIERPDKHGAEMFIPNFFQIDNRNRTQTLIPIKPVLQKPSGSPSRDASGQRPKIKEKKSLNVGWVLAGRDALQLCVWTIS
jgi:hypothetical protein